MAYIYINDSSQSYPQISLTKLLIPLTQIVLSSAHH